MNKERPDYQGVALGGLGLLATAIGLLGKQYQLPVIGGGILGIAASMIWMKLQETTNKLNRMEANVEGIKKDMESYKNYRDLKEEISILKTMILPNKKGDFKFSDLLFTVLVAVLIYLILLGLGVVKPLN